MNLLLKTYAQFKYKRSLSFLLSAVVMVTIVQAGVQLLPRCTVVPSFTSPWFAAAVVLAVVYRIINAYGWTLVLRAMNQHQVAGLPATRIWIRSESRRWLPGGVWGYASRAAQARELGVASSVASASMLLELLLTMAAAVIIAAPVALIYCNEMVAVVGEIEISSGLVWMSLAISIAFSVCAYAGRKTLARKLTRLRDRFDAFKSVRLSVRALATTLLFYVCMGLLNGCVSLFLVWSLPGVTAPAAVIVAATSLAWVVGFLAVFAPGGLFVREGIFAVCLAPWLPYGTGIALAVLARALQIAAEFLGMLWVVLPARPSLSASSGRLGTAAEATMS